MYYCVVVVALACLAHVHCYSTGAPDFRPDPTNPMAAMQEMMDARCTTGNLRPKHSLRGQLVMPQTSPSPFTLTVDNPNVRYSPFNPKIKVTLKAPQGRTFKGFFITGDAEDVKGFEGIFEPDHTSADARSAKMVKSCVLGITHGDSTPKSSVSVLWTPPANYTFGRVQFKATVVEKFDTFWTGVLSNVVDPAPGLPTQTVYAEMKAREVQQQFQAMFNGQGGAMNMNDMMKNLRNMMPGGGAQQPMAGGFGNMFQG